MARRLQLVGYRIWFYGTAPLTGEAADDSLCVLIEQRARRFLPICRTTIQGFAGLPVRKCRPGEVCRRCRATRFNLRHSADGMQLRRRGQRRLPGVLLGAGNLDYQGLMPDLMFHNVEGRRRLPSHQTGHALAFTSKPSDSHR
ncbi:hypothetical protein [Aureliella helgolandensis]|uniref:hypothetical protein n=1 Tax=Aureliella helgolandensis TaxID=2527968 RepID=UPI0018D07A33|nr:hypothetical protein [Aureliella helgolandensis]